ncbi:MAG: hypothetical protein KKA55_01750 [Proteobacteria bacterium]|nr:hypothetical protein [Pseudomonadota bacterium]MBU1594242.1 hypothetical protein [Pseudomonadota bacterium]
MIPAPVTAPPELRPALECMLDELAASGLDVGLVPAQEQRHPGHSVRMVLQRNPAWYRELAAANQRHRRVRAARFADPRFKRADVVDVLQRLLTTGSRSYLARPLLAVAEAGRSAFEATNPWAAAPAHQPENFPYDLPADTAARMVSL